jgi:hypothetical protein
MILFLSESFLRQFQLQWKPTLTAFLIGHRNLFFFAPDSMIEVAEITPASIDMFLKEKHLPPDWQLLGFLAPELAPQLPGYARVRTAGNPQPPNWEAVVALLTESGLQDRSLEIRSA